MDRTPCYWLVVPCYNEAERLEGSAFAAFSGDNPQFRFLFVDDGSTDETASIIHSLTRQAPDRLDVIELGENQGKAEAVRRGVLHLLATRHPDCVGFIDADLATPLTELHALAKCVESQASVQMAIGSRVRLLGRRIDRHVTRHYFGRVAATIVSIMLGIPVYDTQCGAKLFRATPTLTDVFDAPFETKWAFDVEILARWLILRRPDQGDLDDSLIEVPMASWSDVPGSKLTWRDLVKAPLDLIRIQRRYGSALRQWKRAG